MNIKHFEITPSSILSEEEMINVLGGSYEDFEEIQQPDANSDKCNKCDKCDKCTWFCS
ncbi:hypothetical protein [Bacteroides timonensis]|uniref:hypothetical protein n=1 Tax=Bacteroides timonensis TaxID=1470345 RepID=UPI0004BB6459|nr:hypothetical protein [Bacteroides timonensis]